MSTNERKPRPASWGSRRQKPGRSASPDGSLVPGLWPSFLRAHAQKHFSLANAPGGVSGNRPPSLPRLTSISPCPSESPRTSGSGILGKIFRKELANFLFRPFVGAIKVVYRIFIKNFWRWSIQDTERGGSGYWIGEFPFVDPTDRFEGNSGLFSEA